MRVRVLPGFHVTVGNQQFGGGRVIEASKAQAKAWLKKGWVEEAEDVELTSTEEKGTSGV